MTIIKKTSPQGLTYFQENTTPEWLTHGFFGRTGGVSQGPYTSLNCKIRCNDAQVNVCENRNRIKNVMGLSGPLLTVYQEHGAHVIPVKTPWTEHAPQAFPHGDAVITQTPGQLIGVLAADCNPLLFYDTEQKVIAAAHAGWRGALAGIIQNTLLEMQKLNCHHIHALIGPSIFAENYEVGMDVYEKFVAQAPSNEMFFQPITTNTNQGKHYATPANKTKFLLDLRAYIQYILTPYSLQSVVLVPEDTYTQPDLFFSCRRTTHEKKEAFGCQLSVIGIKE